MCLIIYKPAGVPWNNTAITNAFENNPDGAGLMFPQDGKVRIERAFWTTDLLFEHLGENDLTDKAAVLHFRWATHGKVDVTNCHPFPVQARPSHLCTLSTRLGVVHNGIIPGMESKAAYSDTLQFITHTLVNLKAHIGKVWFSRFLANATNSKFAFMAGDGVVTLVGKFVEEGGLWYSNYSFEALTWPAAEEEVKGEGKADRVEEFCLICGQDKEEWKVLGGVCLDCERVYYDERKV